MTFEISPTTRIRPSPYYDATVAAGVKSFTVYNRMLLPTGYGDPEAEYWRLVNGVSMWDVAGERQVELRGPDAARLAQAMSPRRLDSLKIGRGWYIPVCDHRGVVINDPILLKLAEDHFWFSIADSELLLWARALAAERRFDVEINEPDVSPLAIQGPKAEAVVVALLGESVRNIRHFAFETMDLDGIPLVVARSGWSKQGGFELYLLDGTRGQELWDRVAAAGAPFDIGPGCPNAWERVESGLLSWGGDTDDQTNPFEVRMGRYVDLDAPDDVVGIQALRRIKAEGVKRQQLGVFIASNRIIDAISAAGKVMVDGRVIGKLSVVAWSPRLERNLGIVLVDMSATPGTEVEVKLADGQGFKATLTELPFI